MSIRLDRLSIRLGEFDVQDASFEVSAKEYFVLLGPSGAGKTVLIECIAGLYRPDRGTVFLNGHDVTRAPLERRGIGFVPQDYALFPNMTVEANIAFGPRARRVAKREVDQRVDEALQLLAIEHLRRRAPITLSGGEQQRVALARALAVQPEVLLLDEPLAALDESTSRRLYAELRELPCKAGVTVIHVCHDFEEMLALADRVAVMRSGRLEQTGSPDEILHRPRSRFVAQFTNSENIFPIVSLDEGDESLDAVVMLAGDQMLRMESIGSASPNFAVVRPEWIEISLPREKAASKANAVDVTVRRVTPRGPLVHLDCVASSGESWSVLRPRREVEQFGLGVGDAILILIAPRDVHIVSDDNFEDQ